MANEYAELAEMKATLEITGETFADDDIRLALTAASRGVDNVCSRRFWLDDDNTQVRYYTPDNDCTVTIDDLVDLTSVETDQGGDGTFEQAWTENTDFVLKPLNAPADGRPWTTLQRHPNSRLWFPCYPRTVKVTGQFGWTAVPDSVKSATMILASKLVRRVREAPFGVVAFGLEGGAAMQIARNDPDVMFLLNDYTLTTIAVA